MTLEDFVRDSLSQIVSGAIAAHNSVKAHGAAVNPAPSGGMPKEGYYTSDDRATYPIDFDVAVTASEAAGSQAKVGVVAGIFGAGAGVNESEQSSRISRLKFRIYLSLPPGS